MSDTMTAERLAEIRELVSGNAEPGKDRLYTAVATLLTSLARAEAERDEAIKAQNANAYAAIYVEHRGREQQARADAAEAERDAARQTIADARYLVEQDVDSPAAMRATLAGNGLEPGIAEEYRSDLDRVTIERDEARAALAKSAEHIAAFQRVLGEGPWPDEPESFAASVRGVMRVIDAERDARVRAAAIEECIAAASEPTDCGTAHRARLVIVGRLRSLAGEVKP